MPDPTASRFAIVGMSVLLPGAPDLDTYWRNLVGGVDAITEVPPEKWDSAHYAPDAERRADRIYCFYAAGSSTNWPKWTSPASGSCRTRSPPPNPTS